MSFLNFLMMTKLQQVTQENHDTKSLNFLYTDTDNHLLSFYSINFILM